MLNLVFAKPCEQPPVPSEPGSRGVHVWRDVDSRLVAWGHSEGGEHWMHWLRLASFRFTSAGDDITAFPVPGANPDHIADTCLRSVRPMALQALGLEALHASAVLGSRGVVAFCATSQTGKSTLAFGLARRGYPQWADDAVVVEMRSGRPEVAPLPFVVRLRPESAGFYDSDHLNIERTAGRASAAPGSLVIPARDPAPLAAVCVLERRPCFTELKPCATSQKFTGQKPAAAKLPLSSLEHTAGPPNARDPLAVEIDHLEASQAFVALLTHAYCFDPADAERKASMMRHYLEIAARVPILRLTFSDGINQLPAMLDAVSRFIDQGARSTPESEVRPSTGSGRGELVEPRSPESVGRRACGS